ncbi:MAG: hypothetical protein SNJ70_11665 [Armatimonadota bacterium]
MSIIKYKIIKIAFILISVSLSSSATFADWKLADGLSLEEIVNYPFEDKLDMEIINESATKELNRLKFSSLSITNPEEYKKHRAYLVELSDYTSTEEKKGASFKFVNFSVSDDNAIRKLRDEYKISPPDGGAVLRIYSRKDLMPESIKDLFIEKVAGITRWGRFIAINSENMGQSQLSDTISHELAHAYIISKLGMDSEKLPVWFHEGVALYLSDAQDLYISASAMSRITYNYSTEDYAEYKLVFDYLHGKLGERRLGELIRWSVDSADVNIPFQKTIGTSDFDTLLSQANSWNRRNEIVKTVAIYAAALLLILIITLKVRYRIINARIEAENAAALAEDSRESGTRELTPPSPTLDYSEFASKQAKAVKSFEIAALEMAREAVALSKAGDKKSAEQKLQEALNTAGWSEIVQEAIQQARFEIDKAKI